MPACFPTPGQSFADQIGYTVGWGAPTFSKKESKFSWKQFSKNVSSTLDGGLLRLLNEVTTPVLTDTACRARYAAGRINIATQVCSGGNRKGACQVKPIFHFSFQSILFYY
jgi:hypothetical protein